MTQTFRPDLVNVNTTLPCEPLFPRTRPNEEEWYFTFGERARILWICGGKQFFLFFELTEYFHRMDDERLHTPLYGVISRRALFDGVVLDSSLLEALVYGITFAPSFFRTGRRIAPKFCTHVRIETRTALI